MLRHMVSEPWSHSGFPVFFLLVHLGHFMVCVIGYHRHRGPPELGVQVVVSWCPHFGG